MTDEITLDAPETRIERFLAAAAGVEGITLDEPETRIEKYLYKIAQGSGGVPAVEDADKGKYLHANESTGDLEWAEGGSGGGVLVVTFTNPNNFPKKADYTFEEIKSAYDNGSVLLAKSDTSGSMLGQLGYSEAQQGVLASFSGLVMRAAATKIFIDEVKISSDNSVTSTQKKTVEYDT